MSFLETIPNIIARKNGVELSGCRDEIVIEGGMVRVAWSVDDSVVFSFYSDGNWDITNYETGECKEGHTNPPTQKIWIRRIEKLYWPEYAYAAWWEWVHLKKEARRKNRRNG